MKTEELAMQAVARLKEAGLSLSTAESCTGGGIGHALTAVPGSSAVYLGGVISYTNGVKNRVLGVPADTLEAFGAVSPETARAMAAGAQELLQTDLAISVTGLAGPDGDGSGTPVGLVYLGMAGRGWTRTRKYWFSGDRAAVRAQAVQAALEWILEI